MFKITAKKKSRETFSTIPDYHEAEKEGFEDSSHPANPHKLNVC